MFSSNNKIMSLANMLNTAMDMNIPVENIPNNLWPRAGSHHAPGYSPIERALAKTPAPKRPADIVIKANKKKAYDPLPDGDLVQHLASRMQFMHLCEHREWANEEQFMTDLMAAFEQEEASYRRTLQHQEDAEAFYLNKTMQMEKPVIQRIIVLDQRLNPKQLAEENYAIVKKEIIGSIEMGNHVRTQALMQKTIFRTFLQMHWHERHILQYKQEMERATLEKILKSRMPRRSYHHHDPALEMPVAKFSKMEDLNIKMVVEASQEEDP